MLFIRKKETNNFITIMSLDLKLLLFFYIFYLGGLCGCAIAMMSFNFSNVAHIIL
jgi:hypothetical protein